MPRAKGQQLGDTHGAEMPRTSSSIKFNDCTCCSIFNTFPLLGVYHAEHDLGQVQREEQDAYCVFTRAGTQGGRSVQS